MVRARGRLERREGVVNVLVESVEPLERGTKPAGQPSRERGGVGEGADRGAGPAGPTPSRRVSGEAGSRRARELAVAELRAVAPAGHSFGRRGR
jgi:hypothetical protein